MKSATQDFEDVKGLQPVEKKIKLITQINMQSKNS